MTPDTYIKPHSITRVNTQQPALIPNTQYPIPNTQSYNPGPWTLDPGPWTLDKGQNINLKCHRTPVWILILGSELVEH